MNRAFGRVTFALADGLDRETVRQKLIGELDNEVISPGSFAHNVTEHNAPKIAQSAFIWLELADLCELGVFCLMFNESVVNANEAAQAKLDALVAEATEILETKQI